MVIISLLESERSSDECWTRALCVIPITGFLAKSVWCNVVYIVSYDTLWCTHSADKWSSGRLDYITAGGAARARLAQKLFDLVLLIVLKCSHWGLWWHCWKFRVLLNNEVDVFTSSLEEWSFGVCLLWLQSLDI